MGPKPLFPTNVKSDDVRKRGQKSSTQEHIDRLKTPFHSQQFANEPLTAEIVIEDERPEWKGMGNQGAKQVPVPFSSPISHQPAFNPNAGKVVAKHGSVSPLALQLLTAFETPTGIIDFGANEMTEIARHSDAQLDAVKDVDVSFVEQQLTGVISLAKSMKLDTKKPDEGFSLSNLLNNVKATFIDVKEQMKAEFTDVSTKIDAVIGQVDVATDRVKTKLEGFEQMYQDNLLAYQNLTILTGAAEEALDIKKVELEELKANVGSDLLQVEKINRLQSAITRLEKRIVNFKKYETMAIQTAPEITQMADQAMIIIEKFADIKSMTIPLWKRSIRKYIDGAEIRRAATLEKTINDANNAMLQENSNQSKANAIAVAQLNNRDAIDDETLEVINRNLIDTIVEVSTINEKGAISRQNSVERMEEMKRLYGNIASGRITTEELKEEQKKLAKPIAQKSRNLFERGKK